MAAIAVINFALVLLDYSYIPLRDYYLQVVPGLTVTYGETIKGIVPHRTTEKYLQTVEAVAQSALANDIADPLLLASLRQQSRAMIDENPFAIADKTGTLERIKRRVTDYINATRPEDQQLDSAKESFDIFWSPQFLTPEAYLFFDKEIKPLIETNYYRNITAPLIGTSGIPVNRFILIDISFIVLFSFDFFLRTIILSRRHAGTNWLDAMLWRWYDIPLLLPFWQGLRVIPVVIRINESGLLNLEPLRNRLTRGILANVAVELTEVVILRVIDQVQNMIRSGDLRQTVLETTSGDRYIDLNGVDELQLISQKLSSIFMNDVLPKAQPDIEALLQHIIKIALNQSPIYTQICNLPGMTDLSTQLSNQLATQLYETLQQSVVRIIADKEGAMLVQTLLTKVGTTFREEIKQEQGLAEMEALVGIWLEEVKINYVQRLAQEEFENLQEETKKIYAITQKKFS